MALNSVDQLKSLRIIGDQDSSNFDRVTKPQFSQVADVSFGHDELRRGQS